MDNKLWYLFTCPTQSLWCMILRVSLCIAFDKICLIFDATICHADPICPFVKGVLWNFDRLMPRLVFKTFCCFCRTLPPLGVVESTVIKLLWHHSPGQFSIQTDQHLVSIKTYQTIIFLKTNNWSQTSWWYHLWKPRKKCTLSFNKSQYINFI